MFELLQHPPASPEQARLGASVSLATHLAFVLTLAVGADRVARPPDPAGQSIIETAIRYLLPPDKTGAQPAEEHAQWATERAATREQSSQVVPNGTPTPERIGAPGRLDVDGSAPVTLSEEASAQAAFTLLDVDSAAVRDPESAAPAYPTELRVQGIEGSVVVRFVVDTTGRADLASYRLMYTDHPLFGAAVHAALPGMKFRPATIGPMKVRQLVEVPFTFRIIRQQPADVTAARQP